LPLNKKLRKRLGKDVGEFVTVTMEPVRIPDTITPELYDCFHTEDVRLLERFQQWSLEEQQQAIRHIYATADEDAKAQRILALFNKLSG
jgi:hypothetical protein